MTCIVALAHNGAVTIGGDSALTDDDFNQASMAETKVFRKGEFLIGGSGSARGGQLMRFRFTPPKRPRGMDADEYMATLWVDELRKVFKTGGHTFFETEGGEESSSTNGLIGYRGSIWVMYGADFQIERLRDAYAVIGSGGNIALGAMHATRDIVDLKPEKRVKIALEAACRYNAACRPPFTIDTLEPKKKGGN
jgi:ATP-dependent protease HslVU (ClpYQ) peptidase subunit